MVVRKIFYRGLPSKGMCRTRSRGNSPVRELIAKCDASLDTHGLCLNTQITPIDAMCVSLEDLERSLLEKYEPCVKHADWMKAIPPPKTTCVMALEQNNCPMKRRSRSCSPKCSDSEITRSTLTPTYNCPETPSTSRMCSKSVSICPEPEPLIPAQRGSSFRSSTLKIPRTRSPVSKNKNTTALREKTPERSRSNSPNLSKGSDSPKRPNSPKGQIIIVPTETISSRKGPDSPARSNTPNRPNSPKGAISPTGPKSSNRSGSPKESKSPDHSNKPKSRNSLQDRKKSPPSSPRQDSIQSSITTKDSRPGKNRRSPPSGSADSSKVSPPKSDRFEMNQKRTECDCPEPAKSNKGSPFKKNGETSKASTFQSDRYKKPEPNSPTSSRKSYDSNKSGSSSPGRRSPPSRPASAKNGRRKKSPSSSPKRESSIQEPGAQQIQNDNLSPPISPREIDLGRITITKPCFNTHCPVKAIKATTDEGFVSCALKPIDCSQMTSSSNLQTWDRDIINEESKFMYSNMDNTPPRCTLDTCSNKRPRSGSREDKKSVCLSNQPCDNRECKSKAVVPSVTATLMDFVNKITSFAAGAAQSQTQGTWLGVPVIEMENHQAEDSRRKDSETRRCVRFSDCPASCSKVEELYFNEDLKKSDGSVECVCETEGVITHKQESGAGSSLESGTARCDGARAQYYHNKLLAVMQILQNKEETCRVQGESLSVAEARIATLNYRAKHLQQELDQKTNEIRSLRCALARCGTVPPNSDDFAAQTHSQEVKNQKKMVIALQDNLSVIEELYRECFYETAKQEQLIETLRQACLDVRLMDREKADQIGLLQNMINAQKWSLDQCQGIAAEVETLKLEISNFLNNSNNDSGVWERVESPGEVAGVGGELRDIMDKLQLLRDMLTGDCTCGLRDENERLRESLANLENQIGDYHQRICAVESALKNKDDIIKQYKKNLDEKEEELQSAYQQISALEEKENDRSNICECLRQQLHNTQAVLQERNAELSVVKEQCGEHENTIRELRQELEKANQIIEENSGMRREVQQLTQQVSQWRRQLLASQLRARTADDELQRARAHAEDVETCYREQALAAEALQAELEEAHARGAQLCAEARRVVCAARHWVRRMRDQHRKQEEKISEQVSTITCLEQSLERIRARPCIPRDPCLSRDSCQPRDPCLSRDSRQPRDPCLSRDSCQPRDPCLSRDSCQPREPCPAAPERLELPGSSRASPTCDKCSRHRSDDTELPTTNSEGTAGAGRGGAICRCRSREILVCSARAAPVTPAAPAPPRRVLKKRTCNNVHCVVRARRLEGADAQSQRPERREAATEPGPRRPPANPPLTRSMSPTEELIERVELLQDALSDGQRRWTRNRLTRQ